MIKKTVRFEDFNGVQHEQDCYFHFSARELAKMEVAERENFSDKLRRIVESEDKKEILQIFEDFILMAYGEKSEDGMRFVKDPEKTESFKNSIAYDTLFWELSINDETVANFINAIVPKDLGNKLKELEAKDKVVPMKPLV